ncbi:hypothetical protein C0Q70_02361, partial [Pomacea canaliculata]
MYLSPESKQVEFGDAFRFVKPWVGEGILLSSGNRWMRARRLLTPAFHFDILKPYIGVYNKTVDSCIETIDKFANSGESFDIYPLLKLCTFDIILKCAMSVDLNVFKKGGNVPYINACDRLLYLWGERIRNIFVYWDAVYRLTKNGQEFYKNCDLVHSFAQEIITKRMQELKEEGPPKKRYLDFLDILLTAKDETGQGLTPLEIRAEVDTFLLAGHETSSTATSWLLHLLSENVDYQKRVQEEVDEVLEGRESKHVLWSDLQKLETLTCCMKEAMRLYPAVPGVGRILTKDTLIDGHTIPAGTRVNVSFILLHRNPDVWEDPHTFRPERFEVEEAKNRNPFAFVPFSAGPRNCIGMTFASNEIRVLVARLLQRFPLLKVRNIRWYCSGILQTKPHWANSKMDRQQWKGKKSKLSFEKKLHHELLKVLNKRAAQLILHRETHQLHRILVTNFSFMDFPVQMPMMMFLGLSLISACPQQNRHGDFMEAFLI